MQWNVLLASTLSTVFLALSGPSPAQAQCTLPYTLTNGQPPDATQVMANFNALVSCLNPGGSTDAVQYNAGSGNLGGVGPLTDGQLLIGSSGNAPQAQTLTDCRDRHCDHQCARQRDDCRDRSRRRQRPLSSGHVRHANVGQYRAQQLAQSGNRRRKR